ncbi:GGDEF domain-containing protein [Actinomarinicola tropica]|uniref:Diguanylate cyclase n=1 Tax=Actinomarinicola tropica TaxID=2789776 RepID=A0A5Q2RAF7_9ACTN|nr:GGDEF domain-containing protein [Actinomarinicola tropica]QGG93859.1 diguanylate cyclase [Actinomarinicola tropica]
MVPADLLHVATTRPEEADPLDDVMRPLGSSFADPALEQAFLRHRVAHSGRTLAVAASVSAAAWLLLAPSDWSGGSLATSLVAATSRFLATGLLAGAAAALWARAGWLAERRGRRLLTGATWAIVVSFLVVVAVRDADPRHLDVSAALFGTAVVLFVPIPLARRAGIVAAFYTGFWALTALGDPEVAPARLAANLAVAAVGAVACGAHLERSARRSFLLLHQLQRRNGDLSAEVTHHVSVQRALTRLASEDELTGLLNRRAFFAAVGDAVDREGLRRAAGAAILVDADRFKSINDHHGHDVGDQVLRGLATTLTAAVRDGDLVARLGGEEFAVYLPGAGLAEARIVAERIRANVADSLWATEDHGAVGVTVSVGVAERGVDEAVDDVIRRADQAMYRSKRAGGDRFVCDAAGIGC